MAFQIFYQFLNRNQWRYLGNPMAMPMQDPQTIQVQFRNSVEKGIGINQRMTPVGRLYSEPLNRKKEKPKNENQKQKYKT